MIRPYSNHAKELERENEELKGKVEMLYEDAGTLRELLRKAEERCAVAGPIATGSDPVNHPAHYTAHPSGVECIQITEHMGFNLGNALKYIWRADLKGKADEDLKKAAWYINREIERRKPAPFAFVPVLALSADAEWMFTCGVVWWVGMIVGAVLGIFGGMALAKVGHNGDLRRMKARTEAMEAERKGAM